MYPGYNQLCEYFNNETQLNFCHFIMANKENLGVWSATSIADSPHSLYTIWKGRFTRLWKDRDGDSVVRIDYNEGLWTDILQHADHIRRTKNAYKFQGLEILEKSSTICAKEILSSMDNDAVTSRDMYVYNQHIRVIIMPLDAECVLDGQTDDKATEVEGESSTKAKQGTTDTLKAPTIRYPSGKDRFRLGDVDISLSFYAFQMVALNNLSDLNVEEHVPHILALSSILLVQDNRWHPDMTGVFGNGNLQNIYKELEGQFCIINFAPAFNKKLSDTVMEVIKDLKREKITRLDAQFELLGLARKASDTEAKIIRSLSAMVEKLPKQALKDDIKETELSHRYVDTFLSPLFDEPDEGVLFRWTSVTNQEAKSLNSGSISKKRPDCCISELDGLYFDASLGFVEVKPEGQVDNKQALSKDLVRLGMLSKNAIDGWYIRGCLAVQVVGFKAAFYLTTQLSDGLYTMMELCTIRIPSCLADLPTYVTQFDDITAVIRCYKKWCVHVPYEETRIKRNQKRDTMPDKTFDVIAASSRCNKRRCYTMH